MNNPQAFPLPYNFEKDYPEAEDGMTLRDYFAAKALGHIPDIIECQGENTSAYNIAQWAYQVADAMLAEREGQS